MELPANTKPALQGAAVGALALAIIGFTWGGWTTSSSVDKLVKESSSKAVLSAFAPVCVDNFNRAADAASQLVELRKASSWQHASFVEKGGWAKIPGTEKLSSGLASACAEMILASKP